MLIKNKYLNKTLNRYYLNTNRGLIQESHYVYLKANKLDKIPNFSDIHHINGNTTDNSIENLELISRDLHGANHSINPNAIKLDWKAIHVRFMAGEHKEKLAKEFSVSKRTVTRYFKRLNLISKNIDRLPIEEIKQRWLNGESKVALAKEYSCSRKYLDKIMRAK